MKKSTRILLILFLSYSICLSEKIILKTEAQQSYPKFYRNQEGKIAGLGIDIMNAIEELDSTISFSYSKDFTPWKRIKKDLETGQIDIYLGLVKNSDREKIYDFLETPLYNLQHVVAVRIDDTVNVKNFQDIANLKNEGIILTLKGSGTISYMNNQIEGLIIDDGGESVVDNIYKLIKYRGRFMYYHNIAIYSIIKKEQLEDKVKVLPTVFRDYYQWAAFSKNVPEDVKKKVEEAFKALSESGKLEEIVQRYKSKT